MTRAISLSLFLLACQGPPPTSTQPQVANLPSTHVEDHSPGPHFLELVLPLESTRADVHVEGVIAEVTLTQVYRNQGKAPLEATYVFPMSTRAAVHAMKMKIGERVIDAEIRERAEARSVYQEARASGRTASLVEENRPNLFRMSVANILPGDRIVVELSYSEQLVPSEHIYELVIPSTVGPRYGEDSKPTAAASRFALDARIDSAVPIHSLGCASHQTAIEFPTPRQARVHLPEGAGDRDFTLRWSLEGLALATGLLVGESQGEKYFLLAMEPPARIESAAIVPREYLFVVDVSGSMGGFPLETAKELMKNLLGGLRPIDRFDILSFAGGSELYAPSPRLATPNEVRAAGEFMERMESGGGTELRPALSRMMALPRSDNARVVVVITDGFVSVEKETFSLVRESLGQANLFAFGIGSSVNRFLIEGLAQAGRGEPFIVTRPEEAARASARFQSYVSAPILRNLAVELEGFSAESLEPPALPDLFAERPTVLVGRFRGQPTGRITLTGRDSLGSVRQSIDLSAAIHLDDGAPLARLWARERLARLEDKAEITRLGLAHHLMTPYTSFVAVDSQKRSEARPITVEQPLPMPEGMNAGILGMIGSGGGGSGYGIGGLGTIGLGGLSGGGSSRQKGPELQTGSVMVRGSLDKNVVKRIVRRHLNELRFCYEKSLILKPALAGSLVLRFTIAADGTVTQSSLVSSTLHEEPVESCVTGAVRRWEFPHSSGMAVVDYPLDFRP